MAELNLVSKSSTPTVLNVVFVHGLNGGAYTTWSTESTEPEFWPQWLDVELRGVSIWTIGYEAAPTRWSIKKSAMAVQDRARNIYELILGNDDLLGAEIAFIGHSMGGLIIKQILRIADVQAPLRKEAEAFRNNVRRIGFIATPHLGSGYASLMTLIGFFVRPSAASAALVRNSPELRDLNFWYRDWAKQNTVQHLILTEGRSTFWGMIVKPDSSDPGLMETPIQVDSDHLSICKPANVNAEVFVHIKTFLAKNIKKKVRINF